MVWFDGLREPTPMPERKANLKRAYEQWVAQWKGERPLDQAMHLAVGGEFETMGAIELDIVKHFGLGSTDYLIDVGCGSGRLAKPLSSYLKGRYLGIDVVPDLVDYASRITARPDWRFKVVDHIGIPEQDGRADMVCFFSVLTHLLHEQGYWYLQEARRVLKPQGKIVFSFLEFTQPAHWAVFDAALHNEKHGIETPLNVFIERSAITVWAEHLDMQVERFLAGSEAISEAGALGQSVCVLSSRS
jgi:ubiquinone/menaquinone biosynthesis C-methylase UbiE